MVSVSLWKSRQGIDYRVGLIGFIGSVYRYDTTNTPCIRGKLNTDRL